MAQITLGCPGPRGQDVNAGECPFAGTWKVNTKKGTGDHSNKHFVLHANCPECGRPGAADTDELIVSGAEEQM